jgi:hypothetical protein
MKSVTLTILTLVASFSLHADPVQQLKDMISMTAVVEGKAVLSRGTTNTLSKFGTQPKTWFLIDYRSASDADLLAAGGQSYEMTWSFSGNNVQAMHRSETLPLKIVPGGQGRIGPEGLAERSLSRLSYLSRFGLHIADTNLVWDGLSFSGTPLTFFFPEGSQIAGWIEVSNSLPIRIHSTLTTPKNLSTRITELSDHDKLGFPRRWRLVIDGSNIPSAIEFPEISFEHRQFPDSLGYTPSMLGESGREFAIFYTNRTAHTVGSDGVMRKPNPPSPLRDPSSVPWWIGIGVVVLAATVATIAGRLKRR